MLLLFEINCWICGFIAFSSNLENLCFICSDIFLYLSSYCCSFWNSQQFCFINCLILPILQDSTLQSLSLVFLLSVLSVSIVMSNLFLLQCLTAIIPPSINFFKDIFHTQMIHLGLLCILFFYSSYSCLPLCLSIYHL